METKTSELSHAQLIRELIIYNNIFALPKYRKMLTISDPMKEKPEVQAELQTNQFIKIRGFEKHKNIKTGSKIQDETYDLIICIISHLHQASMIGNKHNLLSFLKKSELLLGNYTHLALMFITFTPMTNSNINTIMDQKPVNTKFIVYNYSFNKFIIELPMHVFVPKHEIITEKDCDVQTWQMIHDNIIPSILVTDPQCIWIGAKIGDFIRISRQSESSGIIYGYRIVIAS